MESKLGFHSKRFFFSAGTTGTTQTVAIVIARTVGF
jgi:hypothetical protein